jgi:hypothetical protein
MMSLIAALAALGLFYAGMINVWALLAFIIIWAIGTSGGTK